MDGNDSKMHEQHAQEKFAAAWRLLWAAVGTISVFSATLGGIYFSQNAISSAMDPIWAWIFALMISTIELVSFDLLCDTDRRRFIRQSSQVGYMVLVGITIIAVLFDLWTNFADIYKVAALRSGSNIDSPLTIGIIIVATFVFGLSEILVEYQLKGMASAYTKYSRACIHLASIEAGLRRRSSAGHESGVGQSMMGGAQRAQLRDVMRQAAGHDERRDGNGVQ